jgi:WD40 repeat protein
VVLLLVLGTTAGPAPLVWTYTAGNYSWAVAISSDGQYAIAGSDDMRAYFFGTKSTSGKPLWSYQMRGYVRHVAISKNGAHTAVSDTDGSVLFFNTPNVGADPTWSHRSGYAVETLVMSEDGHYLVAGDRQGTISVFKTDLTNPLVWQYVIPGGITAVSLSKSGSLIATATQGGLYFFDHVPAASSYVWVFDKDTRFPYAALSDNASYVVAGGDDGYVYLVSGSGRLMDRQRLGGAVSALSVSYATGLVVSGSTSGNLSLYSIGNRLGRLDSLDTRRPITSAVISENGERISVGNLDGIVSTFDRSFASLMWTYDTGAIVHSLSLSGSGQVTAAVSDTGGIYLFDEALMQANPSISWEMPTLAAAIILAVTITIAVCSIRHRRGRRVAAREDLSASMKMYNGELQ